MNRRSFIKILTAPAIVASTGALKQSVNNMNSALNIAWLMGKRPARHHVLSTTSILHRRRNALESMGKTAIYGESDQPEENPADATT